MKPGLQYYYYNSKLNGKAEVVMRKVRVLIWGFGAMGSGMARMLLKKSGVEITGVCDLSPRRIGKSIFELLELPRGDHPEVIVTDSIKKAGERNADIALLATDSFTSGAFPKLDTLISMGLNVISTAEQMAWPEAAEPELANRIDALARDAGVSVLGTGINPGLMMDLLVVLLTGACEEVSKITARRVNSLSPYGPTVMEEQGVGMDPDRFREMAAEGKLAGHVGFAESVGMISSALGWKLSEPVRQSMEPIVSSVARKSPYAEVAPGQAAGCDMNGFGVIDGETKIIMNHPQQIEPEAEGASTGDYITIEGTPEIRMAIEPEVSGGIGTIAMCVNMIPQVINASPGLKTMLDLPVPRAIMGDMRDRIERELS
jgi:4-hydroxy-tetrahydrodipicolinate reductase